jgi:hypothetical protein
MTINLNKETKQQVGKAIQELYHTVRKMNSIAGQLTLCKSRIPNQKQVVLAEVKELKEAFDNQDLAGLSMEAVDILITASELVMIGDGDTWLLDNPPVYLNKDERTVEDLVEEILTSSEDEKWFDVLGSAEDLCVQLNSDMIFNIKSIGESMLSKFTPVGVLEDSAETEFSIIEKLQGDRYEEVYSEIVDFEGEEFVVFKTKFDKQNNESYPQGKFLKSTLTFKKPEIIVYE